jgi:hypothetical protein
MASGQIYLRPEHDQWDLIRASAQRRPFGAAIVYSRYLAPYPGGHPREGHSPTELIEALREIKTPYVIDPGTPALTKRGVDKAKEAARLRRSPMVAAIDLPLRPGDLSSGRRDQFVDDTMSVQAGAAGVAPPYLEYKHGGADMLELNIAMLRRCVASAAGQRPVAFIQVTRAALLDGVLPRIAPAYAETGVTRVFIRVRHLEAESASAREFGAYLDAVSAFRPLGVEAVPDCVGRLGPPLVAGGAVSFSSGAVYFRKVPVPLLNKSGGGGLEVFYEVPKGWHHIPRGARHHVATCLVAGCVAAAPTASLDDLREHNLHLLREESRLAAANSESWYAARLIASGQPEAVAWGEVLRERAQRAA